MKRQDKKELVESLHDRLEKAQGSYLVDYQGLGVESLNRLRRDLRAVNAEFAVVKNRLLKLASKNTDTELVLDLMQGPTAIALTYDDVVGPAKALVDFAKEFQKLEIKGAQISGKQVDVAGVKTLAALPGRDVLLAQTLSVMQAVPTSFVRVLNGVMGQFMNVLKAIEEKKSESQ
ncbi:MAG TPA: 50S ribosomal protein L10 [Desulfobacteria bacterium]|nr:50S ribosomal protein L10 [Desulfobacteria bacterium]